jgi:hypothetical protein
MIYLKKGQAIFDNPSMVVYDPTGYYDDGTSVICAPVFAPEEPACRYEAKYIAYGGIVYAVSNEEDLLKQILEIDPKSLFGKDSKQVAVDKIIDTIVTQDTSQQDIQASPEDITPKIEKVAETTPETEVPTVPVTEQATTTPPEDLIPPNATTTPVDTDPATTTPPIDVSINPPPIDTLSSDTSTTTTPVDVTPVETLIESVVSLTK